MTVQAGCRLVRLLAGVGGEVHRSGLEKGPSVDRAAAPGGRGLSDRTLLSTTFVQTKALPATFVQSNVLSAIFAQSTVLPATFAQTKVLPETLV